MASLHGVLTLLVAKNNPPTGVTPAHFYGSSNLTSTFHVVATNKDRDGNEFISTIEGKDMPLYSTQWYGWNTVPVGGSQTCTKCLYCVDHCIFDTGRHPEKVQFEWWYKEAMNHSPDSVLANSHFSHFFVNEVRQARHTRAIQ